MIDRGEVLIEGPTKLITNKYQQYLFAPNQDTNQILKEIRLIDRNLEFKKAINAELLEKNRETDPQKKLPSTDLHSNVEKNEIIDNLIKTKAIFIKGFDSKSKLSFKNADVEIKDMQISTCDTGEIVNALLTGDRYIISFNTLFGTETKNVYFGVTIRTEKGVKISGSNTKNFNCVINRMHQNSRLRVNCFFTCHLLPGNYYVNISVMSTDKNDKVFILSKIDDAVVFKVQNTGLKYFSGLMSLSQKFEIEHLLV